MIYFVILIVFVILMLASFFLHTKSHPVDIKETSKIIYHYCVGIGTLFFGIAAMVALYSSDKILTEILNIEKKAEAIDSAVCLLHNEVSNVEQSSQYIITAVEMLERQLSNSQANHELSTDSKLSDTNPNIVKHKLLELREKYNVIGSEFQLPKENSKIDDLAKNLSNAHDISDRTRLLGKSLQYKPRTAHD